MTPGGIIIINLKPIQVAPSYLKTEQQKIGHKKAIWNKIVWNSKASTNI